MGIEVPAQCFSAEQIDRLIREYFNEVDAAEEAGRIAAAKEETDMGNDSTASKLSLALGANKSTIEVAIKTSMRENRTVELEHSDAAAEELLAECEGSDDAGLYWGQDCEGVEWQVRLV